MKNFNRLNKIVSSLLFFFLLLSFFAFNSLKAYAATGDLYVNFCNVNPSTYWEVAHRIYGSSTWLYGVITNNPNTGPISLAGYDFCSGYVNGDTWHAGTEDLSVSIQWMTACVDPVQPFNAHQTRASGVYYDNIDVSCASASSSDPQYGKCQSGGWNQVRGTVNIGDACPPVVCTSNCSTAGARQCINGNASQTCQTVSGGCLQWVTTDNCSSGYCDNGTGYCRHQSCNGGTTCGWAAGDGANQCPNGSSDCAAPPSGSITVSPTVLCSAGAPRVNLSWNATGASTYEVSCYYYSGSTKKACNTNSTTDFIWNPTSSNCSGGTCTYGWPNLPVNTTINYYVQNQGDAGSRASGSVSSGNPCSSSTCTYQQCENGSCVSHTQSSPCPTTNCNACSGPTCMNINAKIGGNAS